MSEAIPIDGGARGYVRFYRKLIDSPLFTDKPAAWLKIWIFILLRVNYRACVWRPQHGKPVTVPAGSMVTSVEKLATVAATSRQSTRSFLNWAQATGTVTIRTTNHWTMISVTNWGTYQQLSQGAERAEQPTEYEPDPIGGQATN